MSGKVEIHLIIPSEVDDHLSLMNMSVSDFYNSSNINFTFSVYRSVATILIILL